MNQPASAGGASGRPARGASVGAARGPSVGAARGASVGLTPPPAPSVPPGQWTGGVASARATCLLAPNPSPMTLEGTNTWLLREPGSTAYIVIDPGPGDEAHLQRVLSHVEQQGGHVALTLLTHDHSDHAEGAARFGELTRAPVHSIGRGHSDLRDGDSVRVDGLEVCVVATPGHSADSVSFLLPAENALLTGDTILGWGTTVVFWPDGELTAYLDSLERIKAMTGSGAVIRLLPGHGGIVEDAAGTVQYYLAHRRERLEQVAQAVRSGAGFDADRIVETVYADVSRDLWPAARRSVQAQVEHLRRAP